MRDIVVEMSPMGQMVGEEKIRYVETGRSLRKRDSDIGYVITISTNKIKKDEIGIYPSIEVLVLDGGLPNRFFIDSLDYPSVGRVSR